MFQSLAAIVSQRRWALLVLAAFVVAALGMGSLQPKLQEDSAQAPADTWLPSDSDSYRSLRAQEELFGTGDATPGLVVFAREDGEPLTSDDLASIGAFVSETQSAAGSGDLEPLVGVVDPNASPSAGLVSEDRTVAMVPFELSASDQPTVQPAVDDLRERAAEVPGDLTSHVTGPAGLVVDSVEVFQSIDVTLLMATVTLILVLLLLIYRSPLVAFVPIVVVALAYMVAAGLVYLGTQAFDQPVNQQSTAILIVLMFGAGTDYCLLLVARFREELHHHEDPAAAMRVALPATAPAIMASGGTVVLAMLCLLVADYDPTRQMGPVLSLGIAVMLVAGVTLLPAVLVLLGRRSFWPAVPRVEDTPPLESRRWGRVANAVARHPRRAVAIPVIVLCVFTLGNTAELPLLGFGSSDTFKTTTDSGEGVDLLASAFPAGELAANHVVVRSEAGDAQAAAADVAAALEGADGVERATPTAVTDDGTGASVDLVVEGDPFGETEANRIEQLREVAADAVDDDVEVLVGGPTAQAYDTNEAVSRDTRIAVPLVLTVVFLVLVVLLRAIVAPIHLLASVVLGYAATVGLMTWLFANVLDAPGMDAGFPFFVFLFAVALGVDYNIFLVHRIREEAHRLDSTRAGTIAGLATTGGVITSAGLILAGTFMVLAVLPVLFLYQLGFAVAVGVLLDTFIVRTFVVPGAILMLGRRNWWPGHSPADDEDHPHSTGRDDATAANVEREPANV